MSQHDEFDDEDTLVWIGPSASVEGESNEDFGDDEVTGVFTRPDLPEMDIDFGLVGSSTRRITPPAIMVDVPAPIYDATIPAPSDSDSSRGSDDDTERSDRSDDT